MTKSEARSILAGVWGNGENLSRQQALAVEAVELPGETALATVARLAEVNVDGIPSFDHAGIRQRIAIAEVRDAR